MSRSSSVVLGCALALSLACNERTTNDSSMRDERTSGTNTTATDTSSGQMSAGNQGDMNVTGCVQRGDGSNTYILTSVNRPAEAIGTTGDPSGAAREQIRSASGAYRLRMEGNDRSKMDDLVGKQVRVIGKMITSDSLPQPQADTANRIKQGNLAEVQVASITMIGEVCGANGAEPASSTGTAGSNSTGPQGAARPGSASEQRPSGSTRDQDQAPGRR
jgi:hypothetical protein